MSTSLEKTTDELMILTGDGYGLKVPEAAIVLRETQLKACALITGISNNAQAEATREIVKQLASIRNRVGKSREAIKAPVLKIGREIDQAAKDYLADLEKEEKRLTTLIANYAAEIERQRRAAEEERIRLARAEAARLEEEARKQREAEEAKRRAEEEAARAAKAAEEALWNEGNDAAKLKEEAEEKERLAAEERARAAKAEEELQAAREDSHGKMSLVNAATQAEATKGVKWVYDFEVEDIHKVYAANRSLVDVTPKRSQILAAIAEQIDMGFEPEIPGLRISKNPKVQTR